jgi:tape measure domain-containing protein
MAQKVSSLAIDINVTGAPQASAALDGVEKKGAGAAASLGSMATKGLAAGAALGAVAAASRKMLEAAEQYNRIGNRLAVVTETAKEAADVQAQLFRVAQQTGTEFEALASTYARIALSAKDLGVTQAQMVQVTANVAKSLQVSGASAAEAAAGATQLAQALGSGKLQGDELKSILENAPVLARSIAAGLGVSVGQLRQMGSEGKLLSSDVFAAILGQTNQIDAAFGKMGTSMERSSTRLANSFTRALASIDDKIGASRRLSALFDAISEGLDGRSPGGVVGGSANAAGGGNAYTAGFIPGAAPVQGARPRSTRPMVGMGNRTNLPTVRVTADAPRPGRGGTGRSRTPIRRENPGANPSPLGSGMLGAGLMEAARAQRMSSAMGSVNAMGFAGGNIAETIGNDLAARLAPVQERIAMLGQGIGMTLTDSISNGITAAVQSGSIGEGFKELGRTLVGGLGAAVRDFGLQALAASTLMETLKTSLMSFLPGAGIAASLGLIALGSAMVGLAGRGARSSFGRTNTGIDRGASQPSTMVERGTLSANIFGGGMASGSVSSQMASGNPVMVNATIIGYNDPRAQRDIAELMKRSAARGAV